MKEFNAQTGGRYVYVDDVLNLQELALAFSHIFDDCDNFIVSGCEVTETTIKAGYVYLNGKIRHFSGATGITAWPQYLYENNTIEDINYASGGAKTGRSIYGVAAASSIPATTDAITGKTPVAITVSQSGGMQMKDAFFGKYALILNPATLSQVLNGALKINGTLEVTGNIRSLQNKLSIIGNQGNFDAWFNTEALTLQTKYNVSGNSYALSMEDKSGIKAYVNNNLIVSVTEGGVTLPGTIQSSAGVFGGIGVKNGIYNYSDGSDNGTLNINMVGYAGGSDFYRNTIIGNGKGAAIVTINGKNKDIAIDGAVTITSATDSLTILADKAKDDTSIHRTITWKDKDKTAMSCIGYANADDSIFRISNTLAGVGIYGADSSFVDLGPAIKENGQLLTDKYVLRSDFDNTISTLATTANTYTKEQSDSRFSQLSKGFADYVSIGGVAKDTLCQQIGAATINDLAKYASLANCLSDMATDDTQKAQIRNNLDVYSKSEAQGKIYDGGWAQIGCGYGDVYARQIGPIVIVHGILREIPDVNTVLFYIPNNMPVPDMTVNEAIQQGTTLIIDCGKRDCRVRDKMQFAAKTTWAPFNMFYIAQ